MRDNDEASSAFGFDGTWRDYAPIAFTNLLLTIVTLGFYRFWATTRTRRYLWDRTRFIDDRLEWTGTGKELFVGFLLVLVLFGIPFLFLQFGAQALIFQGYPKVAGGLTFGAFLIIFYLTGVARFRALRYRLSRTYWHGIRGGSDDNGFGYGIAYMWKNVVGYLAAGFLIPWAMMSLWNQRWNRMSFGPFAFRSQGESSRTMKRFLLFYLSPFILFAGVMIVSVTMIPMFRNMETGTPPPTAMIVVFIAFILGFYFLLGLIALAFYAKFFRVAVEALSLGDLDFRFTARTKQWVNLFLGDIALVVCTLGIGYIFLSYRHWKFFITHLEASGEIDFNRLTQSTTRQPGQGEGLLDAFDVGAI
jgi:uncharacterized membrane protein YjgN (DUF898 family)